METVFIVVSIILALLMLGLIVLSGAMGLFVYYAMKNSLAYQSQIKEYGRFFEILLDTLTEDTVFLRSELARTIKADQIPQYRELTHGLVTLETHVQAIREAMRDMNLISE